MTLLVGIYCTDGVVVAADSAMTFGSRPGAHTISHPARKIEIINDQVIVAGTGEVGLGQRFGALVTNLWNSKMLKGTEIDAMKLIARTAIQDFAETGMNPGGFGALVSLWKGSSAHLCEFAVANFQPELKTKRAWYVSMGSGQSIADPYLALMRHVFWQSGPPTVEGGKFAAAWVMEHALRAAPGFVGPPIDVAVLKGGKASLLTQDEMEEHLALVTESDRHFRAFEDRVLGNTTSATEDIPNPT